MKMEEGRGKKVEGGSGQKEEVLSTEKSINCTSSPAIVRTVAANVIIL